MTVRTGVVNVCKAKTRRSRSGYCRKNGGASERGEVGGRAGDRQSSRERRRSRRGPTALPAPPPPPAWAAPPPYASPPYGNLNATHARSSCRR